MVLWAWDTLLFQTYDEDVFTRKDSSSIFFNLLTILILVTFIVAFSLTIGTVWWVYATEVLSLKGMSIAVFSHWICNWFVAFLPTLAINLKLDSGSKFTGEYVVVFFFLFSGLSMCGFFLIIVFAKETHNVHSLLIPDLFKSRKVRRLK